MNTRFHTIDSYPDTFGGRVKRMRALKGIEQKDLAAAVKVTVLAIKNIENHNTEPLVFNAAQIARKLGVSLDWLVFGDAA